MKEGRTSPQQSPRARRTAGRAQSPNIGDTYKAGRKLHEPSVCSRCGAVFHEGRWTWASRPANAAETICPACHRIADHYPAGVVTVSGGYVDEHKSEILRLARNQEEQEKAEHPLNRIMDVEEAADGLVINTTDIHLPRRIGEALHRAFHGTLDVDYDEDGYFVRVNWRREA